MYPLFYLGNAFAMHALVPKYFPIYTTLSYEVRHEIVNRLNNSFSQLAMGLAALYFSSPEAIEMLSLSFGMFLFCDMMHMLLYYYDWLFYAHHMLPIGVYLFYWDSFPLEVKAWLCFAGATLELTTPAISMAWIMSKLKIKTWYYTLITGVAYLNFFALRIVYFPYTWYVYLPATAQLITFPYHLMNIFWFWKMTAYVLNTDSGKKRLYSDDNHHA